MNKTIKIMTVLLWLLALNILANDSGYIMLKNDKKLISTAISSDSSGNIFFLSADGKLIIPASMVNYVSVKKPAKLQVAENLLKKRQYKKAATEYAALAKKYRFLGWYACSLAGQADALFHQKKYSVAKAVIKPLLSYKSGDNNHEEPFIMQAYHIYAKILLIEKRHKELTSILYRLKRSSDSGLSTWAFNIAGQEFLKQKRYRAAAREFIQPVLLYAVKTPNRRESLQLLVGCLNKFDKKLSNFYLERLKNEYNDSILSNCR